MKKFTSVLLVMMLMFALTGCAGSSLLNGSSTNNSGSGYPDKDGFARGYIGDEMHTSWFDFTVNSAYVTTEYEGYTPDDGNELLVVELTVHNTFKKSVPMFYDDFQAQWNDDAEDAYAWSIENASSLNKDMFPDEYDLAVNQSRTGLLLYEVPAGNDDFSISFQEYFDDDSTGSVFFVYFTAEDRR